MQHAVVSIRTAGHAGSRCLVALPRLLVSARSSEKACRIGHTMDGWMDGWMDGYPRIQPTNMHADPGAEWVTLQVTPLPLYTCARQQILLQSLHAFQILLRKGKLAPCFLQFIFLGTSRTVTSACMHMDQFHTCKANCCQGQSSSSDVNHHHIYLLAVSLIWSIVNRNNC
jgi:hypothetical protein